MKHSKVTFNLDLGDIISDISIPIKKTAKVLNIILMENGQPYEIEKDCKVVFYAKKPNGDVLYNDCIVKDNVVEYQLTTQTIALAGIVECELLVYGEDSSTPIHSPSFTLVNYEPVFDGGEAIESTNEFTALTQAMGTLETLIDQAKDVVGSKSDDYTIHVPNYLTSKTSPSGIEFGTHVCAITEFDSTLPESNKEYTVQGTLEVTKAFDGIDCVRMYWYPCGSHNVYSRLPLTDKNWSEWETAQSGSGVGESVVNEKIATAKRELIGGADDLTDADTIHAAKNLARGLVNGLEGKVVKTTELNNAINSALLQAKESGKFDGDDGLSAYEIWLSQGNTGSETDFLESLKGADGAKGEKGDAYTLTEADKDEIAETVKTEVPLVKVAEQPTFVDSVDEMIDTRKVYVMPDGFLYAYMQKTTVTVGKNHFVPTEAILNARLSGSSGSITENGSAGSVVTGFIPVSDWNTTNPFEISIGPVSNKGSDDNRVVFYDVNKTKLGYSNIACSHDGNDTPNGVWENGVETYNLKVDKAGNVVSITDVAYIRIQILVGTKGTAIADSDVANLQIKFVHETGTTTQTGFFSTGQAYNQPADYESDILQLKKDVTSLNEAVVELQSGGGNDSDSEEVSVPTAWETAVEECITKVKALQVGRQCVTFPFFSDTHTNFSHLGALIGKVMKACKIPYCIFGGDSPDSDYITEQTMLNQESNFIKSITSDISKYRFYRTLGNHDGWWNPSATQGDEVTYSREQMYELYFRDDKRIEDRRFGVDGTYYYLDEPTSKTRFIFMNVAFGGDDTQIEWLRDKALSFKESGWAVILFGHAPVTNHYNAFISKAPQIRQVLVDYINGNSENKADVVGWFSGHIHRDRIFSGYPNNELSTEGSTDDNPLPFKTITIMSDNTNLSYDSEKHPLDGSDESHAIDFVTINKNTRTVNITRLGFGADRSYTY